MIEHFEKKKAEPLDGNSPTVNDAWDVDLTRSDLHVVPRVWATDSAFESTLEFPRPHLTLSDSLSGSTFTSGLRRLLKSTLQSLHVEAFIPVGRHLTKNCLVAMSRAGETYRYLESFCVQKATLQETRPGGRETMTTWPCDENAWNLHLHEEQDHDPLKSWKTRPKEPSPTQSMCLSD